jgi:hypothetical protein
MVSVTETAGPLHFEDLEPKRFEDLARQLLYDFRSWRVLEPTGRAGPDHGFDARGLEAVGAPSDEPSDDDQSEEHEPAPAKERQWLVQCKRERQIGPYLIVKYLEDISKEDLKSLYGVIFIGVCDFSKRARDAFRKWCREHGISECYLWGKADIEDQLFQPKNDNLLFAYFGFSLQIRKRSLRTVLRSRLAIKRKVEGIFGYHYERPVLLRDVTDERYPKYLDREERERDPQRWAVASYLGREPEGIKVERRRCYAYIADDGESWDALDKRGDGELGKIDDPWSNVNGDRLDNARAYWRLLLPKNQAYLRYYQIIKYDDILDIDEQGDRLFPHPHVYLLPSWRATTHGELLGGNASPEKRIDFFPHVLPQRPKAGGGN